MAKLQEQQQQIHELQRKLQQQKEELVAQQQNYQQKQEEHRTKEEELKLQLEKLEQEKLEEEKQAQELTSKVQLSDSEWEKARNDVMSWSPEIVTEWARRVCGLDHEEMGRMLKMKLTGPQLLKQMKSDFLMAGFPLGPSTKLAEAVQSLLKDLGLIEGPETPKPIKNKRSPKIAVIGAGFSGIGSFPFQYILMALPSDRT